MVGPLRKISAVSSTSAEIQPIVQDRAPQTNSEAEESNVIPPAPQAAETNEQEKEPEAAEAAELQSAQEAKQSKDEKDMNSSSEADNQPPEPKVGVDPH